MNESYLESNIRRLNGVFEKILEFIDENSEFLKLANEIKSSGSHRVNETEPEGGTTEFDFVLNSIWSHIVACFDLNLNVIFSPADPDLFHANFTLAFDFIAKFEAKCCQLFDAKKSKQPFLNDGSQAYKYFVKKWPVQVYYQIRFQEIVSRFEDDLIDYARKSVDDNDDVHDENVFDLNATDSLVKQMEYCWLENKCFLKCLLSQFWKLNLQLIARYCMFFIKLFQAKTTQTNSETNNGQTTIATNVSTAIQDSQTTTIPYISTKTLFEEDLNLCVLLINDADKLLSLKVDEIEIFFLEVFFLIGQSYKNRK